MKVVSTLFLGLRAQNVQKLEEYMADKQWNTNDIRQRDTKLTFRDFILPNCRNGPIFFIFLESYLRI